MVTVNLRSTAEITLVKDLEDPLFYILFLDFIRLDTSFHSIFFILWLVEGPCAWAIYFLAF